MALNSQEFLLYRNFKTMLKEPLVHDTLVNYAQMQYNIALKNLLSAKDPYEVGKWQQAVMIYEHLINLKSNVERVLANAKP